MQKTFPTIFFLCIVFALFFFRLGDRALWSSDEGRYAEIPREMLQQGDFISPHLNYVCYFEKPPLVYWLTVLNLRLFGQSAAVARFWPAFLGALGVCAAWFFARRWFGPETGFWSAWFLTTSVGYFLVGRYLVLDMPFTFFFALGLLCFLEGFESGNKPFLIAGYVALALATLVKGIVACVFPFLIVSLYLTWTRQWPRWKETGVLWGVPLVLAIVAPWFLEMCRRNPTFFQFFFVHEHLQRFVTHEAGRPGPVYYFFGIGMLFFFPWSLFVFFIGEKLCTLRPPATAEDRKRLFLGIWLAVIFLFFTVSRSKLPPYILPLLPPLAILTGFWVKELFVRKDNRYTKIVPMLFLVAFAAICVGVIVLAVFLARTHKPEKVWIEFWIYSVAIFFLLGGGAAFFLVRRPALQKYAFLAWGMVILLSYPAVLRAMENLDPLQSTKELAGLLRREAKSEDTIAIYGGFEDFSDLPFYLRRRLMIVGTNVGELSYGSQIGDQKAWFLSLDEFQDYLRKARQEGKKVFCLAQKNEYNELIKKGIQNLEVLLHTPKAYLLIQHPVSKKG